MWMLKSELFYGLESIFFFPDLLLSSLLKYVHTLLNPFEESLFILLELGIFLYFIGIIKEVLLCFTGTKKEH